MRVLILMIGVLFIVGCGPKYQMVNNYQSPTSEEGKACLIECDKVYASCKEICKANFEICKVKAHETAEAAYEEKIRFYHAKLERYANEMQMYELQRDLYYYDSYYGYRGYGFYHPYRTFWMEPYPYFRPQKPIKPNLEEEKLKAEMQFCQVDCGCTKSYDNCFQQCGGVITQEKVLIKK